MHSLIAVILPLILLTGTIQAQDNRIEYNDQQLFLSGSNIAWISFAHDIGPGNTNFDQFEKIFKEVHASGGNAMRLWLHTNGANTPEFGTDGMVTGPGENAISDLEKILDLAWENEVGLMLCLWSFDMLRESFGDDITQRSRKLLTDSAHTASYIYNALIPMVDSLKGHPAIQSWEIFNEPEGMSEEFGFQGIVAISDRVPMTTIQRFVNRTTGAIHRTDSSAKVTNGSWSFMASTDVNGNTNYYRDDRLIEAGGDSLGTLDFYSVHYYDWAGTELSPFHHQKAHWDLDKPVVIAEYHPNETFGVAAEDLFKTLYRNGYAGSLSWSWTDNNRSEWNKVKSNMEYLWDNHKDDVNLLGIAGDPPSVTLTAPADRSEFPADTSITLEAEASDPDGNIVKVEFAVGDTILTELTSSPYRYRWEHVPSGIHRLKAIATDDSSQSIESNIATITVGSSQRMKYEAENASISGSNVTIEEDESASGNSYVFMNSETGTIKWTVGDISTAGKYNIAFGYSIPVGWGNKTQKLSVNETVKDSLEFENSGGDWNEKTTTVTLEEGTNSISIVGFWGYMNFDYLAVDTTSLSTDIEQSIYTTPQGFKLKSNYPNPFNPQTVIPYALSERAHVKIGVYDVTGRLVRMLVDRNQSAGSYQVTFNADNLSSGLYIYRMYVANRYKASKRMLLIK